MAGQVRPRPTISNQIKLSPCMYISSDTGDGEEKVISQAGEIYFIFGSIIGCSPSNGTKGDLKVCSSIAGGWGWGGGGGNFR